MNQEVSSTARLRGVVVLFGEKNSYGFIKCKELDEEVFVHHEELEPGHARQGTQKGIRKRLYLEAGDEVEFQLGKRDKGFHALRVRVLGER